MDASPLVDMVLFDLDDMTAARLLMELLDREIFPASLNGGRCSGVEFRFRMIGGRKSAKTLLLASRTRSVDSAFFCPSAMLDMIASHFPGGRCFRGSIWNDKMDNYTMVQFEEKLFCFLPPFSHTSLLHLCSLTDGVARILP